MIGIGRNLAQRPTANVWQSGADLEFRFADDMSINPRVGNAKLLCTRAGDTATVFNRYGVLETVPHDTPRLNHDPSVLRYENNVLYCEDITGAAWANTRCVIQDDAIVRPDGKLAQKIAADTNNNTHYVNQTLTSAPSGSSNVEIWRVRAGGYNKVRFEAYSYPSAAYYVRVTFDFVTGLFSGTSVAGSTQTYTATQLDDEWWEIQRTYTLGGSETQSMQRIVIVDSAGNITFTGDGTSGVYFWRTQLNSGSTALEYQRTGATAFPKEYACRGLLVEEARTNSIRNNTMVGAAVGSPGTLPTNWGTTNGGLTCSVIGTGIESGINYVDLRFNGTTTATTAVVYPQSNNLQAASSGQSWTGSWFAKLVGGSLSGVSPRISSSENSATGIYLTSTDIDISASFPGLSTSLADSRFSVSRLFNNASTAYANTLLYFAFVVGAVVDFTIRIGMPQLEQGAFATSVIPTSGSAVMRNADVVYAFLSAAKSAYTVAATFTCSNDSAPNFPRVWCLSDGTNNNFAQVVLSSAADTVFGEVFAGAHTFSGSGFSPYTGARTSIAMAFQANNAIIAKDGTANAADTSINMPSGLTKLNFGCDAVANGGTFLNGHLERLALWGYAAANSEIGQLAA